VLASNTTTTSISGGRVGSDVTSRRATRTNDATPSSGTTTTTTNDHTTQPNDLLLQFGDAGVTLPQPPLERLDVARVLLQHAVRLLFAREALPPLAGKFRAQRVQLLSHLLHRHSCRVRGSSTTTRSGGRCGECCAGG
jgi:hypothetical protein